MMRRTGQEVKSLAVIYVIGAFLDWHFWTGISGLECDEGIPRFVIKTVPHHLDDREASRDSPPVTRSQIAQDGPKSASQDRSKMPANGR
jgi:hypothetical protein